MTPNPSPTVLISVEAPLYYWYETPVGWAVVALMLIGVTVAAVFVVRAVQLRTRR